MEIDSNTGKVITLEEAQVLIKAFKTKFQSETKASFVGVSSLQLILKQAGCMGVRIYYGYDEIENVISPVLVGVNEDGQDMEACILDKLKPCPPNCGVAGALLF